jgi:hypothetical protein
MLVSVSRILPLERSASVELVGTAINAAVVAAVGLILGWLGKERIDRLDARIDRFDARIDRLEHRFDRLGDRFDRVDDRFDRLEQRMDQRFDALRSDLTRVALAVGVRPEAETGG